MDNFPHQVFNEKTYYAVLREDMANARGRVVFHVPFASIRRIKLLQPDLESCVRRSISVCSFIEQPIGWSWKNNPPENKPLEGAVELLLSIGSHVTMRRKIHEKVIIIDDDILHEGSMNVLSHFDRTERMNRWSSMIKVREALEMHRLMDCKLCFPRAPLQLSAAKDSTEFLEYFGTSIAKARKKAAFTQSELKILWHSSEANIRRRTGSP